MYRNDWHIEHATRTERSAQLICDLLLRDFPVQSVLDVGCGHGHWLKALRGRGVTDVVGCDGPWTDRSQLVVPEELFQCINLEDPLDLQRKFDLVLCTEVGEHVAEAYSAQLVRSLVAHSDLVFFGAAIPYQAGYRHINEHWQSWWAERFAQHNYIPFDIIRPRVWNEPSVHYWYKQNPLVYIRRDRGDLIERATHVQSSGAEWPIRFDIVHPEKFVEIASYTAIAFRPFLQHFPGAVYRKMTAVLFRN
jgi:SAM-dependent methyltransferase